MTPREAFRAAASFERPDRLPAIEWASWWDKTLERWSGEGLGHDAGGDGALHERLGLDRHDQFWTSALGPACPKPASHGAPRVRDSAGFRALSSLLFPKELPAGAIEEAARIREERGSIMWMTFEGFFWFPRELFGIENHLLVFYDQPELMLEMNDRLADWQLETLERFCGIAVPDFMTFAEDLSYNLGPMISRDCFEEFMTPFYRRVIPELKKRGIKVIIDSDGDISSAIPWFIAAGIEGALPLERQAGVDVAVLRALFPRFFLIGGYDKLVMKGGDEAMRREFERLLPAMRAGGYIPSVDHQTPPDVTLADYRRYVSLLREYCLKACQPS